MSFKLIVLLVELLFWLLHYLKTFLVTYFINLLVIRLTFLTRILKTRQGKGVPLLTKKICFRLNCLFFSSRVCLRLFTRDGASLPLFFLCSVKRIKAKMLLQLAQILRWRKILWQKLLFPFF